MSRTNLSDRAAAVAEKAKQFADDKGVLTKARSLVSGDAQFFASVTSPEQIREQLADESTSTKKEGMKRIIAGLCKGQNMSALFPDVVKNIHVNSIELRKLVYYYIVHYAEERPNESLLSISAFQKDLMDSSMHVRSLALRMLSSIRIPAIHSVVMIAIKKCSTDPSPIVRKTAAISLAQAFRMSSHGESSEIILQLLHLLLGDKSTEVVGAAAVSYMEICPNQVELIHRHFRKICRQLVECDPWGQVVIMNMLLRYVRTQFTEPNGDRAKKLQQLKKEEDEAKKRQQALAKEEGGSDITTPDTSEDDTTTESDEDGDFDGFRLDSDHRLLITSVKPLLYSLNRAVVIGAVSILFHVAPRQELDICVRPLLRLLTMPAEGHLVALNSIYSIVLERPELFIPYTKDFFLNADDIPSTAQLKLRIIAALTTPQNFTSVSHEMRSYLRSYDVSKVVMAVHGLGLISVNVKEKEFSNAILQLIAPLLSHRHPDVVTECVVVLRQLVVQGSDADQTCRIVHQLMIQLMQGEISAPAARASILWLVGENIGAHVAIAKAAPDCFRLFTKVFVKEFPEVKRQILTLGCKLWLHLNGEGEVADRFRNIFFYVLELVKYDDDYELRDRGRIIECALDRTSDEFGVLKEALLATKPLPWQRDPFAQKAQFQLGSLSHLCGTALLGYQALPEWPEEQPNPDAREPPKVDSSSDEDSDDATSSSFYSDEDGSNSTTTSSYEDSPSSSSDDASTTSDDDSTDDGEDTKPTKVIVAATKLTTMGTASPFVIQRKIATTATTVPKAAAAAPPVTPEVAPKEEEAQESNEVDGEDDADAKSDDHSPSAESDHEGEDEQSNTGDQSEEDE